MVGSLQLVSQTSFSALSVADIEAHLNVQSSTATDAYVQSLLNAAVAYVERQTGMDCRSTTWNLVLDQFPIWASFNWYDRYGNYVYLYPNVGEYAIGRLTQRWQEIPLKRGPLQTVSSIQYYDMNNQSQTLASNQYAYTTPTYFPAKVEPVTFWPVAYPRPDAVTIQFVSGWTTANVPQSVLHAIKLLCGTWYNQREDIEYGPGTVGHATGCAVDALLQNFSLNEQS